MRLAAIALRRTVMLSYEMFAIGIAVVLLVAAIGGLAARVMMGPEETALLRLARAVPAQRRLVAALGMTPRHDSPRACGHPLIVE